VSLAAGLDPKTVADTIATKPGVHFASPNYGGMLEHPVQINPNVLASTHAHYDVNNLKDDWFVRKISADKVIVDDFPIVNPVLVAVVDSGIDLTHPAFQKDLWDNGSPGSYGRVSISDDQHGYDFWHMVSDPKDTLEDSHGTHVAGIASARYLGTLTSALAAERLDPYIKLIIIRVADDQDHVSLEAVEYALDYASYNGAQIVSASWTMGNYPYLDMLFRGNPKTLFIVAAGNGTQAINGIGRNIDDGDNRVYPASYKLGNVITVAASDPDDNVAYFSNWGPNTVDLLAPGVNIKSTVIHTGTENALGYNSGSSQAAPFVTLTASLILAENNLLPIDAVKKRILFTADATQDDLKHVRYGHLNLVKAVAINEDLIEMRDHTFYRGTIANKLVKFGTVGNDCTGPDKLIVSGEKIFRVVVDFDGNTSRLFRGTHVSTGRICDSTVTIKTKGGSIDLSTAKIHDIIWSGIPQFELPN
jgi:subtilisin family serine protease